MKTLRTLFVLSFLALTSARAGEALLPFEAAPPAATHPSLYSFADVYRLTVAGEPFGGFRFSEAAIPVRLASQSEPVITVSETPELRFSVSAPRDGQLWALGLAGLFACAWVAHRRLASPY
jgi:hypothetical protein